MNIGIVGVGKMGGAMGERLRGLGWSVAVRDRVPERERALQALEGSFFIVPAGSRPDLLPLVIDRVGATTG